MRTIHTLFCAVRRFPWRSVSSFRLSSHELVGLLEVFGGDGAVEGPGDAHGAAALVAHVVGAAQEGVGGGRAQDTVLFKLVYEQQQPSRKPKQSEQGPSKSNAISHAAARKGASTCWARSLG